MSDEITFNDCCRIILEQGPAPWAHVDQDKPDYRRDLLAMLNKEFGIGWTDTDELQSPSIDWDADGNPWNQDAPTIARNLVKRYGGIADPFADFLEYTFRLGEPDVWKAHQSEIADAATILRQHYVTLFSDLLLLCWPIAAQRTTSWTRLQALGLVVPDHDPDAF